jgi:O-antigen/teichoic acid export membrane protein
LALRKLALDATVVTVARILQVVTTALMLPILARLLRPSDFGLMAAANSILILAAVLADAGFAVSLVRTDFTERSVWSSVFWLTSAWSALLAVLVVALAVPFGWALNEPSVPPLIATMSLALLGQGLLAAPLADLQQRKRFSSIGVSEILGSIAGISAAILFALSGAGPWALVAQSLTTMAVKGAVIIGTTRFRPTMVFDRNLIAEHLHFARNTGAFAFALFLGTQMDNILIARFVGAGPLGIYSMAYRIMNFPHVLLTAHGALYPRLVKLRNDKHALRQIVLVTTMLLSIVIFPPTAMLCIAAKSIFTVVLSDRWSDVASVFKYMAPVGALDGVAGIHVAILMAIGRTDARLRLSLERSVLWLVVLISVVHFGIQAVAAGMLFSYLVYYPRFLYLFLNTIDCKVIDFVRVMLPPLFISVAMVLTHVALRSHLTLTPFFETCMAASEVFVAYIVIGILARRRLSDALTTMRSLIGVADSEH